MKHLITSLLGASALGLSAEAFAEYNKTPEAQKPTTQNSSSQQYPNGAVSNQYHAYYNAVSKPYWDRQEAQQLDTSKLTADQLAEVIRLHKAKVAETAANLEKLKVYKDAQGNTASANLVQAYEQGIKQEREILAKLEAVHKEKLAGAKPDPNKPEPKPEIVICPTPVKPMPVKPEIAICIRPFPHHWGKPPIRQTKDLVELPFGFGKGSSTLAHWIKGKVYADKNRPKPQPKPLPVIRPKEPPRPVKIAAAAKEKMDSYKKEQESLRRVLQTKITALGKDADKETIKKTVETFRKENADRIKAQAEKAKAVHAALKAARPERKPRPEPPSEVKAKIEAVKTVHKELHVARVDLRDNLKEATEEQRKQLLETFKEAQMAKHQELKTKEKELREAIRNQKDTGDRRTSR